MHWLKLLATILYEILLWWFEMSGWLGPFSDYFPILAIGTPVLFLLYEIWRWRKRTAFDKALEKEQKDHKKKKKKLDEMERKLLRHPLLSKPKYDLKTKNFTIGITRPNRLRDRFVRKSIWLGNNHLLPCKFVLWLRMRVWGW